MYRLVTDLVSIHPIHSSNVSIHSSPQVVSGLESPSAQAVEIGQQLLQVGRRIHPVEVVYMHTYMHIYISILSVALIGLELVVIKLSALTHRASVYVCMCVCVCSLLDFRLLLASTPWTAAP
jgi:hypothetical protein